MSQIGQFLFINGGNYVAEVITDVGTAIPNALEQIRVIGGTNIGTTGAGNTVTVNLNNSITLSGSIKIGTTVTVDSFSNGVVISSPAGLLSSLNTGAIGTVLTSSAGPGAAPTWQPIPAPPAGFTWQIIVANQDAAADNGYNCNGAGTIQVRLPAVFALNKTFKISGMNNITGWRITQQAGQQIHWDATHSTTLGAGGYLESTDTYDTVELLCTNANLTWQVLGFKGNITIV